MLGVRIALLGVSFVVPRLYILFTPSHVHVFSFGYEQAGSSKRDGYLLIIVQWPSGLLIFILPRSGR